MHTEKQLVSFGNYLFKRYGVQVYSNDGTNTPIEQRRVHHADLCNWRDEHPQKAEEIAEPLPHGTPVLLCFGKDDKPKAAIIETAHLLSNQIKYDLSIHFPDSISTRVYNIEAQFITTPVPFPQTYEEIINHQID